MSKIEIDLQNMSNLDKEIVILEKRKSALENEIESLTKEVNSIKDIANKEVAQLKEICEKECQEKRVIAEKMLFEAEEKLNVVETRTQESLVIEEQIKELNAKTEAFKETVEQVEMMRSACSEKEHKVDLLIEQYEQKLKELEEIKDK